MDLKLNSLALTNMMDELVRMKLREKSLVPKIEVQKTNLSFPLRDSLIMNAITSSQRRLGKK